MDGDHARGIGVESPRSIIGRRSRGGQVLKSKGVIQELIPLGRNKGAHSEQTSRTGEFQTRWSVVEGRRGRRMLRVRSSGNSLLVAAAGLGA